MHITTILVLPVVFFIAANINAQDETLKIREIFTDTRMCIKAEAKGILGGNFGGCCVTGMGTRDDVCFVRFCGGLFVGTPDLGFAGAKVDFNALQCYTVVFDKPKNPMQAMKILTGPGGKEALKQLSRRTKESLEKLSDDDLRKAGVSNEAIKLLKDKKKEFDFKFNGEVHYLDIDKIGKEVEEKQRSLESPNSAVSFPQS